MSDLYRQLQQHPFCQGLDAPFVAKLADCATSVSFAPGDYLAREGSDADATYLITAGRVALRAGRETVETVDDGEPLGWSWLFDGTRWHVDATAITAVRAVRLDGPALDARMHADPAFGHAFARHLLRTVHGRLARARLRSLDTFGGPR